MVSLQKGLQMILMEQIEKRTHVDYIKSLVFLPALLAYLREAHSPLWRREQVEWAQESLDGRVKLIFQVSGLEYKVDLDDLKYEQIQEVNFEEEKALDLNPFEEEEVVEVVWIPDGRVQMNSDERMEMNQNKEEELHSDSEKSKYAVLVIEKEYLVQSAHVNMKSALKKKGEWFPTNQIPDFGREVSKVVLENKEGTQNLIQVL